MKNSLYNRKSFMAFSGVLMILLVSLDQLTKKWAVSNLQNKADIIIWEGVFQLEYLENRGAAFGILQNQQWLFIILFVIFLLAIVFVFIKMPFEKHFLPLHIICILVISGGIGNILDRIRLGYVVDFLYFSLIDFPVFNMADIYVTTSMILLFLLIMFYYKDEDFKWLNDKFKRKGL